MITPEPLESAFPPNEGGHGPWGLGANPQRWAALLVIVIGSCPGSPKVAKAQRPLVFGGGRIQAARVNL